MGGENYEAATYEGYGPAGVAIFIEALTNNRSRTAPDIRYIFDRHGGNLATNVARLLFSSPSWESSASRVTRWRKISCWKSRSEAGAPMTCATKGEIFEIITSPTTFLKVKDAIAAANIPIEASAITFLPNNTVAVEGEVGAEGFEDDRSYS